MLESEGSPKKRWQTGRVGTVILTLALLAPFGEGVVAYELKEHPRIFVNRETVGALVEKADGSLEETYSEIRSVADRAVVEGVQRLDSRHSDLHDMLALGICYLVESAAGRDGARYADAVKRVWGDGELLSLEGSGSRWQKRGC